MCDGDYKKDSVLAESHKKIRYVRRKASYYLRDRYRRIGGKNCVYCGFKAQTGDHVPALFLGYINGLEKGVIVSSCYDCNKYLGSFPSTCLKERASFLRTIYNEKEKRYLAKRCETTVASDDQEKAVAYGLKAERCDERVLAVNCNMLNGSAAYFSSNGTSGGETMSYDSFEPEVEIHSLL